MISQHMGTAILQGFVFGLAILVAAIVICGLLDKWRDRRSSRYPTRYF